MYVFSTAVLLKTNQTIYCHMSSAMAMFFKRLHAVEVLAQFLSHVV